MKTDDPNRKAKRKSTWVFLSGFPTLIIKNGNILISLHALPAGLALKLPEPFLISGFVFQHLCQKHSVLQVLFSVIPVTSPETNSVHFGQEKLENCIFSL